MDDPKAFVEDFIKANFDLTPGMILEVHDTEEINSLAATVKNLDYDYQAEQWVQDIMTDEVNGGPRKFALAKFILKDDQGIRAVWKVLPNMDVAIVEKSPRFTGEWVLNLPFTPRRKEQYDGE
jgi:hypothetical protein